MSFFKGSLHQFIHWSAFTGTSVKRKRYKDTDGWHINRKITLLRNWVGWFFTTSLKERYIGVCHGYFCLELSCRVPLFAYFWWLLRGLLSCPYHTTTRPRAYTELDGEKYLDARPRGRVLVAECRWLMWGQLRCLDIIKWHRHSTRLKYDYHTVTTTQPELYQPPRISCQTKKQKKPATAFDFKYHGVTVTAVCFLTFAEKVFSVCCRASFQHVVATRKKLLFSPQWDIRQ